MTVGKETRPTTASLSKWAERLVGDAARVEQCQQILASLPDEDLESWGYSRSDIAAELEAIDLAGTARPRPRLTRYTLERKLVVRLRRNIQQNALGRLVRQVRFFCDALLR